MGSKLKELLDNPKVRNFLRSPELAMLLLVFVSIGIVWGSALRSEKIPDGKTVPAVSDKEISEDTEALSTTASQTVTSVTSATSDVAEETETSAPTEETTAAPADEAKPSEAAAETQGNSENKNEKAEAGDISKYINAGTSPNSDFYQQRIFIAGDSIAYGFNAFGFIPYERNLAQESVSMWNLDYFTFNGMGLVDAVVNASPELLYMSMGMNDVNMNDANAFSSKYRDVIGQITAKCPNINIVVAGITPIGYESSFTSNERIREYNSSLENAVKEMNSPNVRYFDAYSVVSDDYGMLRTDCSSGDGIHLQNHCYGDFLEVLFNYLDDTDVKKRIEKSE